MSCEAHKLAESRRMLVPEDVSLIRSLVRSLPERFVTIVDLGAGSGTTAGAVLAERTSNLLICTYDVSVDNMNWCEQFVKNIGGEKAWAGLVEDSVVASGLWEDRTVDMLMIDTSHEYEHTVQELRAWWPKLDAGAVVWCHDYRGGYPGVTQAVDEAVARGEYRKTKVRGLGIALVKA